MCVKCIRRQTGAILVRLCHLSHHLSMCSSNPKAHLLRIDRCLHHPSLNATVVVALRHLRIGEPFMRRNASAEVSAIEQDREAIKRHILSSKMFLGKLRGPIFGPESSPKHSQRRPGKLRGTPRRSRSRPNSSEPGPSASEACGAEVFPPPRGHVLPHPRPPPPRPYTVERPLKRHHCP